MWKRERPTTLTPYLDSISLWSCISFTCSSVACKCMVQNMYSVTRLEAIVLKICRVSYSALPKKCSNNSLDLIRLFFQKSHYSTYYHLIHISIYCQTGFFGSKTRGHLHPRFPLGGWLVGLGFSFCVQSGKLQTIQQRDHSWAWASFTRVCLRITFYLTCVGTEICTGKLQTIQQRDHSWAQASFNPVHLRIRFHLTCVGTEICTVIATT